MTLDKHHSKKEWSARPRTAARLAAVQALYQMKMTGAAPTDIIEEFVHFRLLAADENHGLGTPDTQLFRDLISGTASHINHIDPLIASALSKEGSLDKLETTLQAILEVGVFEQGIAYDLLSMADSLNNKESINFILYALEESKKLAGGLSKSNQSILDNLENYS